MTTLIFGNKSVEIKGNQSITELLSANRINPALVMVRVNGEIITKEHYESFIVPAEAEVKAYSFIGGG